MPRFDLAQMIAFTDSVIGWRLLGVDRNGDDVSTPVAPEARAFIVAVLGNLTPSYGARIIPLPEGQNKQAVAFAGFLRDMADGIYPPTQQASLTAAVRDYLSIAAAFPDPTPAIVSARENLRMVYNEVTKP